MAKASIFYDIITEYKGQGAKAAEQSFLKLGSLASKLTGALSATALLAFGNKAIQMAAAEDKAFKILDNTLNNLGLGFATDSSNKMIDAMSLATGIAKSELIPAYQQLLTATSDVALSQKDLDLALSVSAGTGKDLATVTTAISKGYLGNTTSLMRLGAGLDKALVKTGNMKLITEQLAKTYMGSAAIAADSYAGKINRIKIATEQATVNIGTGLIDALQALSKDGSITSLQDGIIAFSKDIENAIGGISDLIVAMQKIPGSGILAKLFSHPLEAIPVVGAYLQMLADSHKKKVASNYNPLSGYADASTVAATNALQKKALDNKAKQLAAEKAILAAQKAQTIEQRTQAMLKLVGTQSDDIAKAEILAAKKRDISDLDRAQLDLQFAILDAMGKTGDAALKAADDAFILKEQILAAQGLIELANGSIVKLSDLKSIKNPFAGLDDYTIAAIKNILAVQAALDALKIPTVPGASTPSVSPGGSAVQRAILAATQSNANKAALAGGNVLDATFSGSNPAFNDAVNAAILSNASNYNPLSGLQATTSQISAAGAYNPLSGMTVNVLLDPNSLTAAVLPGLQNVTAGGIVVGTTRVNPSSIG